MSATTAKLLPSDEDFFKSSNIDDFVVHDGNNTILTSGFGQSLWPIHQFVARVLQSKQNAFEISNFHNHRKHLKTLPLGIYYGQIKSFLGRVPKHINPYGYIGLFQHCCQKLNIDVEMLTKSPGMLQPQGETGAELFNRLLCMIREEAYSDRYIQATESLQRSSHKNLNSLVNYVNALFAPGRYSKLLVVRVDLSYRKEFANSVTWFDALNDFKHFLANRRWNRLFLDSVGYVRKLEFTPVKGPHFHVFLFFDGQRRRSDYVIAKQVCEYWQEVVTKGKGYGHNCNQALNQYKHLGIGMIPRNDHLKQSNLFYALNYLCKKEQELPVEVPQGVRAITHGELPIQ